MLAGTKNTAHSSGGRLEDLSLAACVTAEMTDLSTLCAAQMAEIDSSKDVGSSTSAGTRLSNNSTVSFELAEVGRVGVDSGSGGRDARRDEGVLNLTAGFVNGCGRLRK